MAGPPTLVLITALLTGAMPPPQADRTSARPPAASACRSGYWGEVDFDDRTSRAIRDIRACERAGTLAPQIARRALSQIAQLQDTFAYDRRRGWGLVGHPRDRRAAARLASIMIDAGIAEAPSTMSSRGVH